MTSSVETAALLLSASRVGDTEYLAHALPFIKQAVGDRNTLLFVPYAGVGMSYDDYTTKVRTALEPLNIDVVGIHQCDDPKQAIAQAQIIAVGGGNTFHLLYQLQRLALMDPIRQAHDNGTVYIGWSAGSNIAGQSIRTTNDMPIIQPPSFDAIGILNCQINPHYTDYQPPGHNGETRQMRIEEFMVIEPNTMVLGIEEGSAFYLTNNELQLWGEKPLHKFIGGTKTSYPAHTDLTELLSQM